MICGLVVEKAVNFNLQYINYRSPTPIPTSDTEISDKGIIGLYISADAPHSEKNLSTPPIIIVTATGHIQKYTATCRTLQNHLPDQLRKGHIFPNFNYSLVGTVPFCESDCKVLFTKENVTVFDPDGETILTGCWELHGERVW